MFSKWNAAIIQITLTFVAITTANTDSGCDPVVDLLFVLDSSPDVNKTDIALQTNFIRSLLIDHKAPKGAVRIAVMSCGGTNATSTPFGDSYTTLLHYFDKPQSHQPVADIQHNRHCLESVNFKFKTEARATVSRIAILLLGSWTWDEAHAQTQSEIARMGKSVFVVVAVGIKDFGSLSAMQSLAYTDATFFVVSGYGDLKSLAKNLSKGSCKPLSLDLTSERGGFVQTTRPPTVIRKSCIQLSRRMFKRYIPGLGYTRQRCDDAQTLDVDTCQCV